MKQVILSLFLLSLASLQGVSVGSSSKPSLFVGAAQKEMIRLTPEMLVQISDQLIRDDIAEVDIDPEAFDVDQDKPKVYKKNALDDVQFIGER